MISVTPWYFNDDGLECDVTLTMDGHTVKKHVRYGGVVKKAAVLNSQEEEMKRHVLFRCVLEACRDIASAEMHEAGL